jgi:tRNA pseudouridine38-40 synthase
MSAGRRPIALKIAYDGQEFFGWQRQPGLPTVQEAVERALAQALATAVRVAAGRAAGSGLGHPTVVHGAARTDAGVHARGQVCHFVRQALPTSELSALQQALCAALPPSIRVLAVRPAVDSFHARASSSGKCYSYTFAWGGTPEAPDRFHLGPRASPRWELARAALGLLSGLPALPGLSSPGSDRRPAPPLEAWSMDEVPTECVCALRVRAAAFRKHEVRNLAGHLVSVALGLSAPETLAALARGSRPWMRAQAPANGLCLEEVLYPEALDPFRGA